MLQPRVVPVIMLHRNPSNDDPSVEILIILMIRITLPNGDDPSGTNGDNSGTVPTPSEPDVQPAP